MRGCYISMTNVILLATLFAVIHLANNQLAVAVTKTRANERNIVNIGTSTD